MYDNPSHDGWPLMSLFFQIPKLDHVSSRVFGQDTVVACRIESS